MLPYVLGHEPGGTSTRTVVHFAQEVNSGRFCKYDFGSASGNRRAYGQPHPPDYRLARVTVPVALMWSDNDWLADPRDVEALFALPNLVDNYRVPMQKFNHIDFIWGVDADKLVFKRIFKLFGRFAARTN